MSKPTQDQIDRLRQVPEFAKGPYAFISPDGALDFHRRKHVANLKRYCDLSKSIMIDCGCGNGWNVLAFLLEGGRKAIGIDMNPTALTIARQFAQILGFDGRVLFCRASVTKMPFKDQAFDISSCIETLEHLQGNADEALADIKRVTNTLVLVTTPNKLCPVVAHDTRLPFVHWLKPGHRKRYARLFRREGDEEGSVFVTPFQLMRGLSGFRLVSEFLGFPAFSTFRDSYPQYMPYMGGGKVKTLPTAQRILYAILYVLLGRRSFYVLPSLAGVFKRE